MDSYSDFKIVLDLPAREPVLGFGRYAEALSDVIMSSQPRFAVGVFGSWGSGKTTLLNLISSRLPADKVITVHFSAWRYEKEQHLIVPLLDTIRESLLQWSKRLKSKRLKVQAKEVATVIGKATRALVAGFAAELSLGAAKVSFDANKALVAAEEIDKEDAAALVPRSFYKASFNALSEAFSGLLGEGQRFVVFIDDLDRCLPRGALEVLESMKLFFDLSGFVFVVGLDRQVVEQCVEAKYASEFPARGPDERQLEIRGEDYIKKIFQVPFDIAPIAAGQVGEYLASICSDGQLPNAQRDEIQGRVKAHLEYLLAGGQVNPREVKRFVNSFVLALKVKPHLDPDAVLARRILDFRTDWGAVLESLLADREHFIDAISSANPREELIRLDDTLAAVPESFFQYLEGPGWALRTIGPNLMEYIYGGEAFRSKVGTEHIEMVRASGLLRREIGEASDFKELRQAIASHLEHFQSMLSMDSRKGAARLFQQAERIKKLSFTASEEPAEFAATKKDAHALALQLSQMTKDFARAGVG